METLFLRFIKKLWAPATNWFGGVTLWSIFDIYVCGALGYKDSVSGKP